MDKKIITEEVKRGEEFEKILFYAEQKSWIFITHDLVTRLKELYEHREYACPRPQGDIFSVRKAEKEWEMHVDIESIWNPVRLLQLKKPELDWKEKPTYLDIDPEVIVFLS